jgi:NADH:ubiquinone oxidoreductase subunit 6 (subunit J)
VAVLYVFLNATFVGVAQVLVYIGAVGVLILFAVMLTKRTLMEEESHG